MSQYRDTRYRSLIKALSWRVFATITTILVVFSFTQKINLSLGIGAVEGLVKGLIYYLHERLWGRL